MLDKFDLQLFGETEDYITDKFRELYKEYINMDHDSAAELIKLTQMERIATSLELIANSVELLEKLSDCVDDDKPYGPRLIVGGQVSTD